MAAAAGVQPLGDVVHLIDDRHLVGDAQLGQRVAHHLLARAVDGRGIQAVDAPLVGAGQYGARLPVQRLAGPVGDAVGQSELHGAEHQP